MISAVTRAGLVARLRSQGTLAMETPVHTITRAEATQPLVLHLDALTQENDSATGTPWLAPSHLQQVLP